MNFSDEEIKRQMRLGEDSHWGIQGNCVHRKCSQESQS